jgi:Domain of unknown function (DUF4956)
MLDPLMIAIDVMAIAVLVLAVYYPRHRRRDMVIAYIGLNVGVLAVASVLVGVSVGVGVGLGLFGVLSIVRLRSAEISQEEVAYYFASLAIGLICGLHPSPAWMAGALSGLIVVAFLIVGLRPFHADHRQQIITMDQACFDEAVLTARLEQLLGATVNRIVIQQTDLVRDQTVVDVRYRLHTDHPAHTGRSMNHEAISLPTPIGTTHVT